MLKPKYIERLPNTMVELYSEVEQDILADMARRISTYDYWIPAADWQYQKLIEMGNFHSYVMSALSALTGRSKPELEKLMQEAGSKALAFDTGIYKEHGFSPPPLAESEALRKILNAGYAASAKTMQNLTRTTAQTATGQFERALDEAWLKIKSGAFGTDTAVRDAVKQLSRDGVEAIRYPSGHTDTLEVAVRRAVVTGVNKTAGELQWSLADEMESDLVETTAHAGARPDHAVWQGRVFSRSGKSKKYPDFVSATGYGTGAGLCGWNCRHSFFPYFEGSPRAYTPEMLKEFEEKSITYNGNAMTEYEASQQQRYIERNIRRWKRENVAMKAARQDTAESAAKVKRWQETQKDFLKQTGLKRHGAREQIAGYGRKEAVGVRRDVAKYEKYRYNKNGTILVTDDWKEKGKVSILKTYRPYAVVETKTEYRNGTTQIDRTIYDADGVMAKQIHSGSHNRPDQHLFGEYGEHAHDYTWLPNEKRPNRIDRNLTDSERKEHTDILGGVEDG